ncbi:MULTISPECIES: SRPBCC family protein [Acidobacteriaceae]|uniref:SRPBCC family protein n=1 Tax=Acidobacteriaceae TaxID=204434 RepID=UPI00131A679D|nr:MULTISPECIES: SRPBCC family protein [Acidobacteriaceae]MDW5265006.1 SRPBCC family protein [Edaphobacter sp.]
MHTFHSQQWLPLPAELVFAFFANPSNLPRLMPAWQQARIEKAIIVSPPPPPNSSALNDVFYVLAAGAGTRLTISFRPIPFSPVRLKWQAEIDSFVWNQHFSDVQVRGPFAHWHHTHALTPETRIGESGNAIPGTLLQDEVQYQLPLGRLGNLAHPLITRQLRQTFVYRHRRTRELLAANFST